MKRIDIRVERKFGMLYLPNQNYREKPQFLLDYWNDKKTI